MLKTASKQEKKYIARRAQEVENSKQAALDMELNDIMCSSSTEEINRIVQAVQDWL